LEWRGEEVGSYEDDRMISQIETSLASNMPDDVYQSKDIFQPRDTYQSDDIYVSNDVYRGPDIVEAVPMSRAEYIRQVREACHRQLDIDPKQVKQFKAHEEGKEYLSNNELASYHGLIIRSVCAIVIFIIIFAIDKLDVKVGSFSSAYIKDFVTTNKTLEYLENLVVTWLK
jgi:hypothetical protein